MIYEKGEVRSLQKIFLDVDRKRIFRVRKLLKIKESKTKIVNL